MQVAVLAPVVVVVVVVVVVPVPVVVVGLPCTAAQTACAPRLLAVRPVQRLSPPPCACLLTKWPRWSAGVPTRRSCGRWCRRLHR